MRYLHIMYPTEGAYETRFRCLTWHSDSSREQTRGVHVGIQQLVCPSQPQSELASQSSLYPPDHLIHYLGGLALSPQVRRQTFALPYHLICRPFDPICSVRIPKVA